MSTNSAYQFAIIVQTIRGVFYYNSTIIAVTDRPKEDVSDPGSRFRMCGLAGNRLEISLTYTINLYRMIEFK